MARRILAIDTRQSPWQLAVARPGRAAPVLEQAIALPEGEELSERIAAALGGPPGVDDRIALALPCTGIMVRWLEFPFADRRKMRAALGPELARQLPVEVDSLHLVYRPLDAGEGGHALALAIERARLEQILEQFEPLGDRLHTMMPAPFALADTLSTDWPNGLLVCVSGAEITLIRLRNGLPVDLRVQPRRPGQKSIDQVSFIVRQGRIMLEARSAEDALVLLAGESPDSELAEALREFGFRVEPARPTRDEGDLLPEQYGAVALALAAGRRQRELNLLSGPYAPRGDWKRLRPRLLTAAILLTLALVLAVAAGWLQLTARQQRLAALDRQLESAYRKAFPTEKRVVDPVRQLEAKLGQLRKTAGGGETASPLEILRLVSAAIPADLPVRIRDYSHNRDGVRIEGETASFETVSRLVEQLRALPAMAEVTLSDSRQKSNGQAVEFRLQLRLKEAG
ncbi:MAG: hypothetical protein Tsb0017_09770 [Geothermobacteraceae bacterium]